MKKILKWVFPALLGIIPVMGADAGIIDDPLFTDGTCSIRMVVEAGPTIKALVDATSSTGEVLKPKLVEALWAPMGWEHHDSEHFSCEKINAQVICGAQLLEKEYAKKLKTNYTTLGESEIRMLNGVEVKDTYEPLVGETVTISKATSYERPDGSVYKEIGENLYQLILEETSSSGANFRKCEREWDIISQWKKKTRHQVRIYGRTDVTRTLFKIPNDGEKIAVSSKVVPHFKPIAFEQEVPTCGDGAFPLNAVIGN